MKPKNNSHKAFEEAFSKKHAGYVLITCDQPTDSGEMEVKMTYGGSTLLVNKLIDDAQILLDDVFDDESNSF